MSILINICIALLGIMLYTIFAAKNFIGQPAWSWPKFVRDNLMQFIWSIIAALVIIITLALVPGSAEAIKTMTGIAVDVQDDGTINRAAFFTLGFVLSVLIRTGGK